MGWEIRTDGFLSFLPEKSGVNSNHTSPAKSVSWSHTAGTIGQIAACFC